MPKVPEARVFRTCFSWSVLHRSLAKTRTQSSSRLPLKKRKFTGGGSIPSPSYICLMTSQRGSRRILEFRWHKIALVPSRGITSNNPYLHSLMEFCPQTCCASAIVPTRSKPVATPVLCSDPVLYYPQSADQGFSPLRSRPSLFPLTSSTYGTTRVNP